MLQPLASTCHRYQINASQEAAGRDWAPAARHYLQAARVLPTGGNAYNQLAVLDTCVLLCSMPFHVRAHAAMCIPCLNALSGEFTSNAMPLWQHNIYTAAGVCSYVGDELAAVAHYFCALAVAQPFLVARDNLLLLFEQNRIR
jgi:Est1 DNA/RNA binding domain